MLHTQTKSKLTPFPFFNKSGVKANRILVKPHETPEKTTESGLLVPENVGKVCETGSVISVVEGSEFKEGDEVLYKIIERSPETDSAFVLYRGEPHHLLFENEIWSCNEIPVNRLFIEPTSGVQITTKGIDTPEESVGVLQYGRVRNVPVNSMFNINDLVGYRRGDDFQYPNVDVDGVKMHVLFERDVFVVNGKVSPYRIIVKIDVTARTRHQEKKESGILLHDNFKHMKRNLQYGQVVQIGEKAKEMYPMIGAGDYISFHHFVEHHPYRLVGQKRNSKEVLIAEYRTLNCYEHEDREIFAKIETHKHPATKQLSAVHIVPAKNDYFCSWAFEMLYQVQETSEFETESFELDLTKIKDLEYLYSYMERKRTFDTEKYRGPFNKYTGTLGRLDPSAPENMPQIQYYESAIEDLKRSMDSVFQRLKKNYPVVCKVVSATKEAELSGPYIVTTYKEIYPLNIMGRKYLIVDKHFIHGFLKHNQMPHNVENFVPFGDRVLVEPIIEDKETSILIPEGSALERPVKGIVVAVGPGTDKVQMIAEKGMEVYFKKMGNAELKFGDKTYFSMIQNDLLGGFTTIS